MREGHLAHDLGLLLHVALPEEAHKVDGEVLGQARDLGGLGVRHVAAEDLGALLDLLRQAVDEAVAQVGRLVVDVAVELEERLRGVGGLLAALARGRVVALERG